MQHDKVQSNVFKYIHLLRWPFPNFGVSALSNNSPSSPVLFFLGPLHVYLYRLSPTQILSYCRSVSIHFNLIFVQCRLTSIFHLLVPSAASVVLSSCHNRLASLLFSLMSSTHALVPISSGMIFSIPFIPIIHPNISISVLSSQSCPTFFNSHASLPYIKTTVYIPGLLNLYFVQSGKPV